MSRCLTAKRLLGLCHGILISYLILLSGCSSDDGDGPESFWKDVDLEVFKTLPQFQDLNWGNIRPQEPMTYWELRRAFGGSDTLEIVGAAGNKCATADDPQKCISEFDALRALLPNGFGFSCLPAVCFEYIASNSGNVNNLWSTLDELKAFLGLIDSEEDSVLLTNANEFSWFSNDKEKGAVRQVEEEYELVVLKLVKFCMPVQTNRYLIRISRAGALRILREQVFSREEQTCI